MDASHGQRVRRRSRSDLSDVAAVRLLGIAINGSFLRWRKSIRIAKSGMAHASMHSPRPEALEPKLGPHAVTIQQSHEYLQTHDAPVVQESLAATSYACSRSGLPQRLQASSGTACENSNFINHTRLTIRAPI
jgi:hypothetical protein